MSDSEFLDYIREQVGDESEIVKIPNKMEINGVMAMVNPDMPNSVAIVSPDVMLRLVILTDEMVNDGAMIKTEGKAH